MVRVVTAETKEVTMSFEHVCAVWKLYIQGPCKELPEGLIDEVNVGHLDGACILEAWLMEEVQ